MASTYYDSSGKEVTDGNIAYAADLNDINTAVDTAFQQVETDINAISNNQPFYSDLAEKWATEAEDVEVTTGKYSALHYAAKADDDATQTAADRVQTGLDRTQTGADRVQTGLDKAATAADRVQTGLDKVATAADRVQTGLDRTAAAGSASDAAVSAGLFPTLGAGDVGKYLKVSDPYTDGIETATLDLSGYAPLADPTFTGTPEAPTASIGTNTTQIATTAFVKNSGLQTVPGLNTEGNVMGFDMSKTGANQITVTKGSCLDSTLTVPMALTSDTPLTILAVANTIYHIFVVRLTASGLFTVKAYTSEAAAASDTDVDAFRWIGFCKTNGATAVCEFIIADGEYAYLKPSEAVFVTGFANTAFTLLNLAPVIPTSRCSQVYVGPTFGTDDQSVSFSNNGTSTTTFARAFTNQTDVNYPWGNGTLGFALRQIPYNGTLYAKINAGSANLGVAQVKLRR